MRDLFIRVRATEDNGLTDIFEDFKVVEIFGSSIWVTDLRGNNQRKFSITEVVRFLHHNKRYDVRENARIKFNGGRKR